MNTEDRITKLENKIKELELKIKNELVRFTDEAKVAYSIVNQTIENRLHEISKGVEERQEMTRSICMATQDMVKKNVKKG